MTTIFDQVLVELEKRRKNAPFIIAIDGFGGAGKTTLALRLQRYLASYYNVRLFHLDNAVEPSFKRYHTGNEEWFEYYFLQWDIEGIRKHFFSKLSNGAQEIIFPCYDERYDQTCMQAYSVESDDIILIEGVFVQRAPWRGFVDYSIFLHISKAVRETRIMKRDGGNEELFHKYRRRYWLAEDYYWKTEKPLEVSSLVITDH